MPDLIQIVNNESEIVSTNYWQTENAQRGLFYLSINAGAFRLLVPDIQEAVIAEMATAKEVIVSRGPWPSQNKHDALEFLFEDFTDTPFVLQILPEQADRLPLDSDRDRQGQPPRWKFTVWTEAGKKLERPARYRLVKKIPCMKAWKE